MPGPEIELQIGILRELYSASTGETGGLTGKELRKSVGVFTLSKLEQPLRSLYAKGYVDASYALRVFVITRQGIEYLTDFDNGWAHGSLVPRRPLPTVGHGEIALPRPAPEGDVA